MKIAVVPGYGDRVDYLKYLTKDWPRRFGNDVEIVPFGWSGDAAGFDDKDQAFLETIGSMGEVALIGISAGASAALRAKLKYPDVVMKIVTVCGPVDPELMDRNKLHEQYPLLELSLQKLSLEAIPVEDVMTLRPVYDGVVSTAAMYIEGAGDVRMRMVGHAASIAWGMYHHAKDINEFINPLT